MDHVLTRDGRLRVWETFRRVEPGELYTYLTEPAKLTRWWPSEARVDAVPGGRYRYTFVGVGHVLSGTFTEVEPGQRLSFSWRWEHEPSTPERQVAVDFERRDADTLLTVTQGPYGGGEAEAAERQSHLDGWTHFLKRLKTAARSD